MSFEQHFQDQARKYLKELNHCAEEYLQDFLDEMEDNSWRMEVH